MIGFVLRKLFGSRNQRLLKKMMPVLDQVNAFEPAMATLSDDQLKGKTADFKTRIEAGTPLDDILPEAFAVVREASKRVLSMRHFDVQILGGLALHQGKIAEMTTGEGKTLVATLPVYLNALVGKGVHVVTVNDYLARRDRQWMGPVYEFLGLTVGVIQHDMPHEERQQAYRADITYGTNNEYGFDYLRDNMVIDLLQRVQRGLQYAIVDEVDSILIDEARTPLIISGPAEESTDKYYKLERFARGLSGRKITDKEMIEAKNQGIDYEKDADFLIDEKHRNVWFTEQGERKFEQHFHMTVDSPEYIDFKHHRDQAVKAKELFHLDVDYVVKDGEVIIVDEFTGRLMPGRRFSDGMHQALEAKEGVKIERENQTLATITFQNYFRMYKKLAGMTGTAETEAIEFDKIYKLDVVVIPTNRAMVRINYPDVIYKTEREKFNAVLEEILMTNKEGRPVLVGTVSIEKSERLSAMLTKRGVPHTVLNAKYHEKEAEIISRAGQDGAITISTNMAGRGTDIVLGTGVAVRGGLHVVGTERHEARRIDNQLRGRSGRQGDPGSSRFFLSLEDDLMRIFGGDRLQAMMTSLGMEEGQDIQHPFVSKAIETAQKRVEARNFDIRKHLLEYDNVMNRQREIIYAERDIFLDGAKLKEHVGDIIEDCTESIVLQYWREKDAEDFEESQTALFDYLKKKFLVSFDELKEQNLLAEDLKDAVVERLRARYDEREKQAGTGAFNFMVKTVFVQILDAKWKEHLHNLDSLREGIGLRAYGQRNPLVEYQQEAFNMFDAMIESIKDEALEFVFKVEMQVRTPIAPVFHADQQTYEHPESERPSAPVREQARPVSPATPIGMPRNLREHRGEGASPDDGAPPEPFKREEPKVGRNEPCPCGSGKKYKKCCGKNE